MPMPSVELTETLPGLVCGTVTWGVLVVAGLVELGRAGGGGGGGIGAGVLQRNVPAAVVVKSFVLRFRRNRSVGLSDACLCCKLQTWTQRVSGGSGTHWVVFARR
ncbi:hypothetical protein CBR_g37533 [Chara braunii]|uniref:Uncharacterized protein n=1 Tax=Chara braunii TaxID=69332 RepID=A0A388LNE4_CHABU|nr:hypothetical protein CBR_g37533 [Chara braunii]|eukprot:GBG83732.1 hypothetical protein CBR_g37533 [Chara braunii]